MKTNIDPKNSSIDKELMVNGDNIINPNENNYKETNRKKIIYGKGHEAISVKNDLGDFDAFNSETYKIIIKNYGKSIRFNELLGIINAIQLILHDKKKPLLEKLTRNEKRSFPLLIKYIERNNEQIIPYFKFISLCDSSFKKISLDV